MKRLEELMHVEMFKITAELNSIGHKLTLHVPHSLGPGEIAFWDISQKDTVPYRLRLACDIVISCDYAHLSKD
jgi:hypothetical protein